CVPEGIVRSVERRTQGTLRAGAGGAASTSHASAGGLLDPRGGQSLGGLHDFGEEERLLGGQPSGRRDGESEGVRRDSGGLVCPTVFGEHSSSARGGQAPHQLSPHHRLAGEEAWGLRALPLSGGPVSRRAFPLGLRLPEGPPYAPKGVQGIPADTSAGRRGKPEHRG